MAGAVFVRVSGDDPVKCEKIYNWLLTGVWPVGFADIATFALDVANPRAMAAAEVETYLCWMVALPVVVEADNAT